MGEEIFREKSLKKLRSPENLDEYIKVSGIGVWMILVCAILLLVGTFIWGFFGRIDSVVPAVVVVESGSAVCYIGEDDTDGVTADMTVKFEDYEAELGALGKQEGHGFACDLKGYFALSDGSYEGEIVVKSYRPLSFLFN